MTHQMKSNKNSNSNNYYGFSSSPDAIGNDGTGPSQSQGLAGGGLSFIIHSNGNVNNPHINSNPHHQQQQSQLGSISSVSSSSGISSGSNTITKSSTFNGNTFTRSKPKERKPIPSYFSQGSQEEDVASSSASSSTASTPTSPPATAGSSRGPLATGKGIIIPTLTLSPDTPPSGGGAGAIAKEKTHRNSSSASDLFFTGNSSVLHKPSESSSGNSTNFKVGKDEKTFRSSESSRSASGSGSGSSKRNVSSLSNNSTSSSSINFQPGACSTFILTEGEEFPEELGKERGGIGVSASTSGRRNRNLVDTITNVASSSDKYAEPINNTGVGSSGSSSTTMKVESQQQLSADGAALPIPLNIGSPNGSSSGIHSNLSGEEENFECFGEGSESFTLETGSADTSLNLPRDGADIDLAGSGVGGASTPLSRNSWNRTSLRKSPQNNGEAMGYRRWGSFRNAPGTKRTPPVVTSSNALANQLYRSSSFHSSGRSSAGDAEEMYSDGSLEDEVIDLTHKVHHLEEKMNVLAENQSDADDRYTREKEKNAELSTKVFMLEEQLRETELRGEEKLREEQRRFKEFQSRWDREKQLQSENYEIRLQSMEKDLSTAKSESTRLRNQLERERSEKDHFSDRCLEMEREVGNLREENRSLQDQGRKDRESMAVESAGAQQALLELKREVENMRQFQMQNSPSSLRRQEENIHVEFELQELKSRLIEKEEEVKKLRKQNEHLQDANDELNAQLLNRGLEEGRTLLTTINSVPAGDSLAAEFEAMSQDQNAIGLYVQSETDLAKVKKALKEQVEVNEQLRAYIDGILLIIVENNPQLLEVKNHTNRNSSQNNNLNDKCHQSPQPLTNGVTKIV